LQVIESLQIILSFKQVCDVSRKTMKAILSERFTFMVYANGLLLCLRQHICSKIQK